MFSGEEQNTWPNIEDARCLKVKSFFTCSLSNPHIFLSTLLLNTLSLCSLLKLRYQVWYPYKETGNIILSYVSFLISMFLDSTQEDKRFWIIWQQVCPKFNMLAISSCMYFMIVQSHTTSQYNQIASFNLLQAISHLISSRTINIIRTAIRHDSSSFYKNHHKILTKIRY